MTCRLLVLSFRAGPTRFSYTGLFSQAMKATEPNAKGRFRTHLKPGPVFVGAASPSKPHERRIIKTGQCRDYGEIVEETQVAAADQGHLKQYMNQAVEDDQASTNTPQPTEGQNAQHTPDQQSQAVQRAQ